MNVWIDYLTKISITLAVIGFLMSFAISYRSYGLAEGLTVGKQELEEQRQPLFVFKPDFTDLRIGSAKNGGQVCCPPDFFVASCF